MKLILNLLFLLSFVGLATAQQSDTDSTIVTNKEAIYNRPLTIEKSTPKFSAGIGGFLEGNTNYFVKNTIPEGFTMELRRFNLYLMSSVFSKIHMIAEVEFKLGTKEINLALGLIDIELHPACVLRGGVLHPPIGMFNQNHDGPKYEFISRPMVSTLLIPSTLSEMGFGVHGKVPFGNSAFTYEAYIVNGLQEGIVTNQHNRTSIPSGKNRDLLAGDNNDSPGVTGRVGLRRRYLGEIGLSYYGGQYNKIKQNGIIYDTPRWLSIVAFDGRINIGERVFFHGEFAYGNVDVPSSVGQQSGRHQLGMYFHVTWTAMIKKLFLWKNVRFNANYRLEYIDFNVGQFPGNMGPMYQDNVSILAGFSVRLSPGTLIRIDYVWLWEHDLFGNNVVKRGGVQFGFSSYFSVNSKSIKL